MLKMDKVSKAEGLDTFGAFPDSFSLEPLLFFIKLSLKEGMPREEIALADETFCVPIMPNDLWKISREIELFNRFNFYMTIRVFWWIHLLDIKINILVWKWVTVNWNWYPEILFSTSWNEQSNRGTSKKLMLSILNVSMNFEYIFWWNSQQFPEFWAIYFFWTLSYMMIAFSRPILPLLRLFVKENGEKSCE